MSTLYQVVTVLGYVVGMTWATMFAPQEAKWPTVIILHGALALGYLIGTHPTAPPPP